MGTSAEAGVFLVGVLKGSIQRCLPPQASFFYFYKSTSAGGAPVARFWHIVQCALAVLHL